ncbi:glycosyltransferase family 4 protein [Pseudomonas sp. MUP55]|uniref:glycosyltransferase family 4 protein n=1 Tax=Pseudomonas sp. MUP55 TaxID=3087234 RepID=UPI002A59FF6F|nr:MULTISPECIES: glycosyltransferase family 4 protein [unclassified Pseudomonas]WPN94328.1 glycosyltransferase family 4 protein [Pseudomonas sp. MUP56]WPN99855.1 glycosyltransferase family 4 protein [Pseudomonas sp. MUP55]
MKKNVVLLTTKYAEHKSDAWLTNEMAYSFRDDGYSMCAVVFSWLRDDPKSSVKEIDGVKVVRIRLFDFFYTTGFIGTALKVFLFPYWARIIIRKHIKECDLLIANTPCVTIVGLSNFFKRNYQAKSYLVLWDFFPFYLKDLGAIRNKFFFGFFQRLETKMYRTFDRIGCMTKGNIKFLLENYPGVDRSRVEILPLWAKVKIVEPVDKAAVRAKYNLPMDKVIAVYGGAMSIVQELENILELARLSFEAKDNVCFLFIGKGTERERLESSALNQGLTNVTFLDYVPRDEYQNVVQASDIGLISLSSKLSVPSFPSKSVDYFKVSLPILASLDAVTDFGSILQNDIKAGFSVLAGKSHELHDKLKKLSSDPLLRKAMGDAGRLYYEECLTVEKAKEKIISIL